MERNATLKITPTHLAELFCQLNAEGAAEFLFEVAYLYRVNGIEPCAENLLDIREVMRANAHRYSGTSRFWKVLATILTQIPTFNAKPNWEIDLENIIKKHQSTPPTNPKIDLENINPIHRDVTRSTNPRFDLENIYEITDLGDEETKS